VDADAALAARAALHEADRDRVDRGERRLLGNQLAKEEVRWAADFNREANLAAVDPENVEDDRRAGMRLEARAAHQKF
jgi:hypothetical protein